MIAISCLSLAAALWTACAASANRTPTIEEFLSLRRALAPRLSPDGRWVAYEVQETDWSANTFRSEIWLAPTQSGAPHPLTRSKKSSSRPRWSPDGKRLAFLSDREGSRQVYLVDWQGSQSSPLTRVESGVAQFEWSPDGRFIAFSASDPEPPARKSRKEKYGSYEVVDRDHTLIHLWRIPVPSQLEQAAAPAERLTGGDQFSVGDFSWSPDSRRIAFSASRDASQASAGTADLYVLDLAPRSVKRIIGTDGPDRNPVWSPDGRQLAYETTHGRSDYFCCNHQIAVIATDGGTPRLLTDAFDERPYLIGWGPDGLYFWALQRTQVHLFRLDAATGKIEQVSQPRHGFFWQFSFSHDFRKVAFLTASAAAYGEVAVSEVQPFAPRVLTRLGEQLRPYRLASREVIRWRSADGMALEGILIKPPDFDAAKKYPLLVVVHGGPAAVDWAILEYDRYYYFPVEQLIAKGAVILRPNYRGSAGYGEKFRSLNVRDFGGGEIRDVLSGVDHLVRQGFIDPQRVGAMGYSYGGTICALLSTSSDRFRALSVGAGVADWALYYATTDIPPFARQLLGATPWEDQEIYRKSSAISRLATARTPTLIQHGELDRRVPPANAYLLYRGLRDRRVPTKLILYRGLGHQIDTPRGQRAFMEHNLEWFGQWIWGEPPAEHD